MSIILPAIFLTLSLIGLFHIIMRKWPMLQNLDHQLLNGGQNRKLKLTLLEERLKRRLLEPAQSAVRLMRPWFKKLSSWLSQLTKQLAARERSLQAEAQQQSFSSRPLHERRDLIAEKLAAAENGVGDPEDTEQIYLEILSLDPRNVAAYEGLAELCSQQKDYEHAREICEYLLKLDRGQVEHSLSLAETWLAQEQPKSALPVLKRAVKIHANNPKLLDKLVEVAIMLKDSPLAKDYLSRLKQANPENQKIGEYKKLIKAL